MASGHLEMWFETPDSLPADSLTTSSDYLQALSGPCSYNLLLDLPSPIDQVILNEWLEMRDIPCLDIALTNSHLRPLYMQLIQRRMIKTSQVDQLCMPIYYENYLTWLASRRIQLKLYATDRIHWKMLTQPPSSSLSDDDYSAYRRMLRHIEVLGVGCSTSDNKLNFPLQSLQACPNLLALILIGILSFDYADKGQEAQLSALKALSLLACRVTAPVLDALLTGAPTLQGLMINSCEFLVSPKELAERRKLFSSIKCLQLIKTSQIVNDSLLNMLSYCSNLEYLKVYNSSSSLFHQNTTVATEPTSAVSQVVVTSSEDVRDLLTSALNIQCVIPSFLTSSDLLCRVKCPLKTVDLEGCCFLTNEDLMSLLSCVDNTIEDINLSNCYHIDDRSVIFLSRTCLKVHTLILNYTNITDLSIMEIASNLMELQTLQCYHCQNLTDKSMSYLSGLISSLTFLSMSECPQVSDHGMESLFAVLPYNSGGSGGDPNNSCSSSSSSSSLYQHSLLSSSSSYATTMRMKKCKMEKLCLNHSSPCSTITDRTIQTLIRYEAPLQTLLLSNCYSITSSKLIDYFQINPSLVWLDVSHNHQIDDDFILQLITFCQKLDKLDINNCKGITDEALLIISRHTNNNLKEINIQNNVNIHSSSIIEVINHCFRLHSINANYCPKVNIYNVFAKVKSQIWIDDQIFYKRMKRRSCDWDLCNNPIYNSLNTSLNSSL